MSRFINNSQQLRFSLPRHVYYTLSLNSNFMKFKISIENRFPEAPLRSCERGRKKRGYLGPKEGGKQAQSRRNSSYLQEMHLLNARSP